MKRILLAIDGSDCSIAAMDIAVRVAARTGAEIVGVFVEDINLLHMASLPGAEQVRALPAVVQPLTQIAMDSELRSVANRLRRRLQASADAADVPVSFRVVRGRVALELLAASVDADMVVLGRISRPLTRRVRVGSTALTIAHQADRPVLLTQTGASLDRPLIVVYDGSDDSERTLDQALELSRPDAELVVLLIGPRRQTNELREKLKQRIEQRQKAAVTYHRLPRISVYALAQEVTQVRGGLLVINARHYNLDQKSVRRLLDLVGCSVLLVR